MIFLYHYSGIFNDTEYFLVCKWKQDFPSIYLAKGSTFQWIGLPPTPHLAVSELSLTSVNKGIYCL